MKADKIHVSNFHFISIEKLEIDRAIGDHARATVRGVIGDEEAEKYRGLGLGRTWAEIVAEDENGFMQKLMTGIIAGFSLEKLPHEYVLELTLKSGTCLMDCARHFRSFQDNSRTYLDAVEEIVGAYGEAGAEAEKGMERAVDFLLQYQETDWAFIKRIASHGGLAVTPDIRRKGVFFSIGDLCHREYQLPSSADFHVSKYVGTFMQQSANGEGSPMEQDYLEYQVKAREIYDLWDFLAASYGSGYIYRIHSEYGQGELIHTYWLCQRGRLREQRRFNECQQGCSFQGEVQAIMEDKVQIGLIGDENSAQETARWFPYSTGYSSPEGAGWYCMPEIGDRIRLQIPDYMEEHGYVISAVHMETGADRKQPDHKSFKTRYGKELLFTPDSLELTNNQGMRIRIQDGEGIQVVSDKDISIIAGGNMTISSGEASLSIAGTESVDIRQGGAGLHMDQDILFTGGKFRIQ